MNSKETIDTIKFTSKHRPFAIILEAAPITFFTITLIYGGLQDILNGFFTLIVSIL